MVMMMMIRGSGAVATNWCAQAPERGHLNHPLHSPPELSSGGDHAAQVEREKRARDAQPHSHGHTSHKAAAGGAAPPAATAEGSKTKAEHHAGQWPAEEEAAFKAAMAAKYDEEASPWWV